MTVWHLSESDVVNMVPADSAVEIAMSTHRQLHFGPTLHTLFAASMSAWRVHLFTCMYALVGVNKHFFSQWSKVGRISCLQFTLPTRVILVLAALPSRVQTPVTLEAKQAYWMNSMCTLLHKGNKACAKPILHNSLAMITSCPPQKREKVTFIETA